MYVASFVSAWAWWVSFACKELNGAWPKSLEGSTGNRCFENRYEGLSIGIHSLTMTENKAKLVSFEFANKQINRHREEFEEMSEKQRGQMMCAGFCDILPRRSSQQASYLAIAEESTMTSHTQTQTKDNVASDPPRFVKQRLW